MTESDKPLPAAFRCKGRAFANQANDWPTRQRRIAVLWSYSKYKSRIGCAGQLPDRLWNSKSTPFPYHPFSSKPSQESRSNFSRCSLRKNLANTSLPLTGF